MHSNTSPFLFHVEGLGYEGEHVAEGAGRNKREENKARRNGEGKKMEPCTNAMCRWLLGAAWLVHAMRGVALVDGQYFLSLGFAPLPSRFWRGHVST
jgi:hypothetical protein